MEITGKEVITTIISQVNSYICPLTFQTKKFKYFLLKYFKVQCLFFWYLQNFSSLDLVLCGLYSYSNSFALTPPWPKGLT